MIVEARAVGGPRSMGFKGGNGGAPVNKRLVGVSQQHRDCPITGRFFFCLFIFFPQMTTGVTISGYNADAAVPGRGRSSVSRVAGNINGFAPESRGLTRGLAESRLAPAEVD